MNCEESSLNLEDYTLEQINDFAIRYLKARNTQIRYYKSDHGKEKYREGARRWYRNNKEKCLAKRKEQYKNKLLAEGKIVRKRAGRPRKNEKILIKG